MPMGNRRTEGFCVPAPLQLRGARVAGEGEQEGEEKVDRQELVRLAKVGEG